MSSFGILGTGWRAEFYLRIAQAHPDEFTVTGIVGRGEEKTRRVAAPFAVPVFASLDALVAHQRPDFVVVSVQRGEALALTMRLAELGIPALCETPAGETIDDLQTIWGLVERGARIQVAEQYWAQPHHAARIAFARGGRLGRVTEAMVSAAHGYHGVSLIRRFLGVMYEPVTVSAHRFSSPIVTGPTRAGLPDAESISTSVQEIGYFDFGDRLGVLDFTRDQYLSLIRGQRLLVRGERGEMVDESAVYLEDFRTPLRVSFIRHSTGANGNLEGNFLKGIQAGESWVYRNPLAPAAFSDEEIAIGTCMLGMVDYLKNGADFYSVAEACQDRYLDLLMQQALEKGETVSSQPQPWHSAR